VPEERFGEKAEVWMAECRAFDAIRHRVGPEGGRRRKLSYVLYNSGKYRAHRGVSCLEAVWDIRLAQLTGALSGGHVYIRERVEIREE
jgi:hypothetical protein